MLTRQFFFSAAISLVLVLVSGEARSAPDSLLEQKNSSAAKKPETESLVLCEPYVDQLFYLVEHPAEPLSLSKRLIQEGRREFAKGNVDEALKTYKKVFLLVGSPLEPHVDHAIALCGLADCHMKLQNWQEAERILETASSLIGSHRDSYMPKIVHARLLAAQKNHEEAIKELRTAAEFCQQTFGQDSTELAACNEYLGILFCESGRLDDARKQFKECMRNISKDDPMYWKSVANLAYCDASEGKLDQARNGYQDAQNLVRSVYYSDGGKFLAELLWNRSVLERKLGNSEEAERLRLQAKETRLHPPECKSVDLSGYLNQVMKKLQDEWIAILMRDRPAVWDRHIFTVRLVIGSDGELKDSRLVGSAKCEILEKLVLKTVKSASPFSPPPSGAPNPVSLEINFPYARKQRDASQF